MQVAHHRSEQGGSNHGAATYVPLAMRDVARQENIVVMLSLNTTES